MTFLRPLQQELRDAYRFPRFVPMRPVGGIFGDPQARVVTLTRRQKKQSAVPVARQRGGGTTGTRGASAISLAGTFASISSSICGVSTAGAVAA